MQIACYYDLVREIALNEKILRKSPTLGAIIFIGSGCWSELLSTSPWNTNYIHDILIIRKR